MNLPYFCAEDLARLFATTKGYVLKKASQGRWQRVRHPTKGKLYRFEDADRDLGHGSRTRHQQRDHKREQEEQTRLIAEEQALYLEVYGEIPDWAKPDTQVREGVLDNGDQEGKDL